MQVQLAVHICVLVVRHLLQCVAFGFGFLVSKGFGYTVIYIDIDIPSREKFYINIIIVMYL